LSELGIENSVLEHPVARNISDVLSSLKLSFSDCSPTLIMKADGNFLAVIIRGDTKADFKKIKKLLSIKDLRMANPDEVTSLTKLALGTARVYNPGVKTIIDRKIFEKDFLAGGSGAFDCSIRIRTVDLNKLPNSETVDISKTE